jgi:hypothetical protein
MRDKHNRGLTAGFKESGKIGRNILHLLIRHSIINSSGLYRPNSSALVSENNYFS